MQVEKRTCKTCQNSVFIFSDYITKPIPQSIFMHTPGPKIELQTHPNTAFAVGCHE